MIVDAQNKYRYIQLMAKHKLLKSIRTQVQVLLSGIYEVVPRSVLGILNERELEYTMCGCEIIDTTIEEWKQCVIYDSYRSKDEIIIWLWQILSGFTIVQRNLLLQQITNAQFVTCWNLSKWVPYMMIARSEDDENRIKFVPKMNRIEIWDGFKTKEQLETALNKHL